MSAFTITNKAVWENRRFYAYYVIGNPSDLFLLRNSYFIIGTFNCVIGNPSDLFLLRNSYFIIGTV